MIKLKSILQEAGLLKEKAESVEFKFEFESGQDILSRAGNIELSQLIARVNDMIKRGSKIVKIKIIGSESKVPSKNYEEGELAQKRAKALKSLLEKKFPDIDIEMISVGAQGPEWPENLPAAEAQKLARSEKYKQYQKVTAKIVIEPIGPTVKEYIMDFAIAIPSQAGKAQGAGADLRNSFFKRIGNGEWKSTGSYNNFLSDVRRLSKGQIQGFNPDEISKKTIDNTKKLDILLKQKDINELINNYKPGNTDVDRSIKMHNSRYWLLGIDDIITFLENS